MISFVCDFSAYEGATCEFVHTSGTDTFTFITSGLTLPAGVNLIDSTRTSAYELARALSAWINDAARPWAAAWTHATLRSYVTFYAKDDTSIIFNIALRNINLAQFTAINVDALWEDLTGWHSETPPFPPGAFEFGWSTVAGQDGYWLGTSYCELFKVENWVPWDKDKGVSSRGGSYSIAAQTGALKRPLIVGLYSLWGAIGLIDANDLHSSPRKAFVYQSDFDRWLEIAVAEITQERVDRQLYEITLKAVG